MRFFDYASDNVCGWHVCFLGCIIYGKKIGVHKLYFSERNGYTKGIKLFGWKVFFRKL